MKVGDKIRCKRYTGIATIIDFQVKQTMDDFKNQTIVRTTYTARFDDGRLIRFHGYDIGKRIFKVEDHEQISFFDDEK